MASQADILPVEDRSDLLIFSLVSITSGEKNLLITLKVLNSLGHLRVEK